jgi:hypothetical protein
LSKERTYLQLLLVLFNFQISEVGVGDMHPIR